MADSLLGDLEPKNIQPFKKQVSDYLDKYGVLTLFIFILVAFVGFFRWQADLMIDRSEKVGKLEARIELLEKMCIR